MATPAAVRAVSLGRSYGELVALRDVSFELPAAATMAVLGPNGSGKTTLVRVLATLLRPTEGEVDVLGAELPRRAWKARGRIGLLGHEPLLYRDLTIAENLAFHARLHAVRRRGEQDRRASGGRPAGAPRQRAGSQPLGRHGAARRGLPGGPAPP